MFLSVCDLLNDGVAYVWVRMKVLVCIFMLSYLWLCVFAISNGIKFIAYTEIDLHASTG